MVSDVIKILIIFIAGVVVGGFLPAPRREGGRMLALKEPSPAAKQREKKESKKEIILAHLELPGTEITIEEVGKMFSVSRATASKYLEELEEEGKLKKVVVSDTADNSVIYYSRI